MIYKLWFVEASRWMVTEDLNGGHEHLMTAVEVAAVDEKIANQFYQRYCMLREAAFLPIDELEIVCLDQKTKKEMNRKVL